MALETMFLRIALHELIYSHPESDSWLSMAIIGVEMPHCTFICVVFFRSMLNVHVIALQAIGEAGVRLILRDYARQEYIVSQQPDELFTVMPGFDDIRTTLDDIPIDPVAIVVLFIYSFFSLIKTILLQYFKEL